MLFDGEFEDAAGPNSNIAVTGSDGKAVQGEWVVSSNPKMLLFKVEPGIYQVETKEGLTAKGDRKLGASSKGTVYIP